MLAIAHRGASAYAPENTLTAFRKAVKMGADGIELDLHLCASGELVVIHDETVDRTTSGRGMVAQMTLAEIKALRIAGGETIPTLDEVLEAIGPGLHYFLECKQGEAMAATAECMLAKIKQGWDARKLTLIGFDVTAIARTITSFPALQAGASFEELTGDAVARAAAMGAWMVVPCHQKLEQPQVAQAHALGLQVVVWTVNDPADIARMKALGVDGIISDYPERLGATHE